MSSLPQTVDEYLASAPPEALETLEKLREIIRTVAPEAVETISYQVPTYKLFGSLVAFGAAKNHCGFYVMSATAMDGFRDELKGLSTSKGTIRLPIGEPLPVSLIEKLVRARIEENEAGAVQKI
jgi:uncharacterized protein YdhG (YjbR/CyaY superfamily)